MTAAFVRENETWPPPAPFALELFDVDGEPQIIPSIDGKGEVPILGARVDGKRLVIPVAFASIDKARRAARTLALAFEKVRAIEAEPVDELDDGHEHRFEEFRVSRTIPAVGICVLCGAREGGDAS